MSNPKHRFMRVHLLNPVDGHPELTPGENHVMRKDAAEALVEIGLADNVYRDGSRVNMPGRRVTKKPLP